MVLSAVASVVCVPLFHEIVKPGADGKKVVHFAIRTRLEKKPLL